MKKKKKIENNDKTCSGNFYSKFNIIQEDSNNQCFIKINLIFLWMFYKKKNPTLKFFQFQSNWNEQSTKT